MQPPQLIRFITRKWPPAVGGMETYSRRLTDELRQHAPLEIIALPGRHSGRAPSKLAMITFGIRTAFRLLWAPEARVIHVADLASWPLAWFARLRHPRTAIVISAHGSDLTYADRRGLLPKLYGAYVRIGSAAIGSASIIANSRYIADKARRAGFERVTVVPLATDFRCPDGGERRHLVFAGRISRAKGLRFLVEDVLPRLASDVRLRVAGALWEESERPLLSHPRVDYASVLSPRELAQEFSRAAAVLIPTRESEGFGLVAIEAAACGAFVLASGHSGLNDVVRDSIGTTLDPNDAEAWASAVTRALSTCDEERRSHSTAARAEVDRCYRWTRVAQATLAIYDSN